MIRAAKQCKITRIAVSFELTSRYSPENTLGRKLTQTKGKERKFSLSKHHFNYSFNSQATVKLLSSYSQTCFESTSPI